MLSPRRSERLALLRNEASRRHPTFGFAIIARVGKKVGGTIVKRWLYRDNLKPVAELDGGGNLVARFVYASRPDVPDYMVRGSTVYRLLYDQLGSIRMVVNVANVSDIPYRADYSAFGVPTYSACSM